MKYTMYLALLLVVVFGLYFFLNKESNSDSYVSPNSSKGILLYKESGLVYIKNKGEETITPVGSDSIEIKNQTEVITGSSSRASVLLPDNSMISLSENTSIIINYSTYGTSVFQSLGQTYHRVQKLVTGKSYEVQTPNTLAAVRGTKFSILYDGSTKKTKIAVTENLVAVSRIKKIEGVSTTTLESPVLVGAGNAANVNEYKVGETKKESQVEIVTIGESPDISSWINENKSVDVKFDEFKPDLEKGNVEVFREKIDKVLKDKKKTHEKTENDIRLSTTSELINNSTEQEQIKTEETKPITEQVIEQDRTTETMLTEEIKPVEVIRTTTTYKKYPSEEEFFTAFDDLLIKYFYIDNEEEICQITLSPENKTREILGLAEANGKTFNTTNMLNLATKIKNYCSLGSDAKDRAMLQSEFESVMPSF